MKLLKSNDNSITCEIDINELRMLLSGIGEICGGVKIPNFETRIGFTKQKVIKLMEDVIDVFDKANIEQ